jgi:hypothetical protein
MIKNYDQMSSSGNLSALLLLEVKKMSTGYGPGQVNQDYFRKNTPSAVRAAREAGLPYEIKSPGPHATLINAVAALCLGVLVLWMAFMFNSQFHMLATRLVPGS